MARVRALTSTASRAARAVIGIVAPAGRARRPSALGEASCPRRGAAALGCPLTISGLAVKCWGATAGGVVPRRRERPRPEKKKTRGPKRRAPTAPHTMPRRTTKRTPSRPCRAERIHRSKRVSTPFWPGRRRMGGAPAPSIFVPAGARGGGRAAGAGKGRTGARKSTRPEDGRERPSTARLQKPQRSGR
jgi:hypothetical protein